MQRHHKPRPDDVPDEESKGPTKMQAAHPGYIVGPVGSCHTAQKKNIETEMWVVGVRESLLNKSRGN